MVYTFDELKALIEKRGVHAEFGEPGEGFAIEQNPHELATFLVRMQELGVQSVLEIGTGYKGGLSRFLAADMGWQVTTYDIQNYGHVFEGVHYIVGKNPTITDKFDLVFIDGAHDMDNVSMDYSVYERNALKVIAFHDIVGFRDCGGAAGFWNYISVRSEHATKCFSAIEGSVQSAGIGWIEL